MVPNDHIVPVIREDCKGGEEGKLQTHSRPDVSVELKRRGFLRSPVPVTESAASPRGLPSLTHVPLICTEIRVPMSARFSVMMGNIPHRGGMRTHASPVIPEAPGPSYLRLQPRHT